LRSVPRLADQTSGFDASPGLQEIEVYDATASVRDVTWSCTQTRSPSR
jgi:hypothetical protein